jgi:hypothetical protein
MKKKQIIEQVNLLLTELVERVEKLEERNKEHDDEVWRDIMSRTPKQQQEIAQFVNEELKRRGLK